MWLILGVVAFVVLIIIIISVTTGKKSDDTPDDSGKFYRYNCNRLLSIMILGPN